MKDLNREGKFSPGTWTRDGRVVGPMTVDPVEDSPPLPPIYVDQDDFSHF